MVQILIETAAGVPKVVEEAELLVENRGDPATDDPATDDPATDDPATDDPATDDPASSP